MPFTIDQGHEQSVFAEIFLGLSDDGDRVYTLLPRFTPVREMFGERKLKPKKKKQCTKGHQCGFSCISKTKICIANMTTAQLKAHNAAKRAERREKAKAKKAAAMGGGMIQTGSSMAEVENKIRLQRFESAALFDSNGNQLFFKDGEQYEVSFSDDEIAKMKDGILTHNHPRGWDFPESDPRHAGNSFSDDDILLAQNGDLKEIRAIAVKNKYSMIRPESGWPSQFVLEDALFSANEEVRRDMWAGIDSGLITPAIAQSRHNDQVMRIFASKINATYTKESI